MGSAVELVLYSPVGSFQKQKIEKSIDLLADKQLKDLGPDD